MSDDVSLSLLDNSHISRKTVADAKPATSLRTVVKVYADRLVVERKLVGATAPPPRRGGGRRKGVTAYTYASQQRFIQTANSIKGLVYEVVLTYSSDYPTSGKVVNMHWDRMRRWFRTQGIGGVMIKEFTAKRGAVHIHLLLNSTVSMTKVREQWAKIVASTNPDHARIGATGEPIHHLGKMINYLAKPTAQKDVPEGFNDLGRFWSVFGSVEYHPVYTVSIPDADVTPLVTTIVRVNNASREKKGFQPYVDLGRYGFTAWEVDALMDEIPLLRYPPPDPLRN